MHPDQAAADAELRSSYAAWRSRYVTRRGAGGHLRVDRGPEDRHDTVSEGIGYGMILAVYMGDRNTFDGLWAYAKRYRNPRGLMSWKVTADGTVPQGAEAAAVDADQDIAFALVVADTRWGGYRSDALRLIGALMRHGVEPGTHVPKPGDIWGGSEVTNPSYFAPAYYKVFAHYAGDARWHRVADASYQILDRLRAGPAGATGLYPDWTMASGRRVLTHGDRGYDYGYEATRVPWRLAKDAAWNCDPRARRHLDGLNRFFRQVGPRHIRDGYRLDGRPIGRSHSVAFVGPVAAGAMLAPDAAYRTAAWREAVEMRNAGYYGASLRLLALLLASGNMAPPALRSAPR